LRRSVLQAVNFGRELTQALQPRALKIYGNLRERDKKAKSLITSGSLVIYE
jgi:hypothetical protein